MKSSTCNFALTTNVTAILLSAQPAGAAALTSASADEPVQYTTTSTVASSSRAATVTEVVTMAVEVFAWFPSAR